MKETASRLALIAVLALGACAPGPQTGVSSPTPQSEPAATASPIAEPATASPEPARAPEVQEFAVARGSAPHDVAPAADGGVWYTGQRNGTLGHLDPRTGAVREVRLGQGSSPHGVIVDPASGVAWVTDSGLNAMVSVDPRAGDAVKVYRLPAGTPNVNLNTATIEPRSGVVWFTGQNGWYGSLDPRNGEIRAHQAPRGRGPYGIATTPDGQVYYASLAGNHIARIDTASGAATPIDPPTQAQGARRVWSDSQGKIWVSEYNAGQVARFDPASGAWKEWRLPGARPLAYSVYVDDRDAVWLTDFAAHAIVRFDPATERFTSFPYPQGGNVRQMLGRRGEVWGALSGLDRLIVIRTP
jgi:virginiamycin B lyase